MAAQIITFVRDITQIRWRAYGSCGRVRDKAMSNSILRSGDHLRHKEKVLTRIGRPHISCTWVGRYQNPVALCGKLVANYEGMLYDFIRHVTQQVMGDEL